MNIRIAKTLLEPVGISWFVPVDNGMDLLAKIEDDLHDYFNYLVSIGVIPGGIAICNMLKARATNVGAKVVVAERWTLQNQCGENSKDIGVRYIVTIAVCNITGGALSRVVYLDSYF